jgi:enoyl-CoA hydratase/carnithine racemase
VSASGERAAGGLSSAVTEARGRRLLHVQLTDAERHNALSLPLMSALAARIRASEEAVLLSAAPPVFCAGLDLELISREAQARGVTRAALEALLALYDALLGHAWPTTALVEGPAVGGGAGLAGCCDLVIARPAARIKLPSGDLQRLARVVVPYLRRRMDRHGARGLVEGFEPDWYGRALRADGAMELGLVDVVWSGAATGGVATLAERVMSELEARGVPPEGTDRWRRKPDVDEVRRALGVAVSGGAGCE